MENKNKIILFFLVLVIVILSYHFVIRPMQMDKKLEKCLYGAGVSADVDLKEYNDMCFKKYSR